MDVLALHAEAHVVLGGADRCGTGAGEHDLDLRDVLAGDLQGIEQGGTADDRGAVLVVVEDGNAHRLAERLFDVETLRRLDVLEVDATDGGLEQLAELDDVVRVLRSHLEIEDVDVGELLEEVRLAFHYGLAGKRTDVAESQHGSPVRNDRDEVAAGRVLVDVVRVLLDRQAGLGDTR